MRRMSWIAMFALVACADPGPSPTEIARTFWDAAREGDAPTISAVSLPARNARIDPTKSASVESVTFGEELVEADRATVATTLVGTHGDMPTVDFHTVLVRTDEGWRVDLDQTTDEMFESIMGVSLEAMGSAMAKGMEAAMQGMAEGMAEGMKDAAEAIGEAMSPAVTSVDTVSGQEPSPAEPPEPLARRPGRSAGEVPWRPSRTGTVRPGMTRDEVVGAWGDPAHTRDRAGWSYLFYRNGCERRCGTFDVVFVEGGQVVDAVVRTSAHQYAGVSSSPPGRTAEYTPPQSGF